MAVAGIALKPKAKVGSCFLRRAKKSSAAIPPTAAQANALVNRGSVAAETAKPWELDRSSSGFERSETFEYLGQLLPTFLEKLFLEMI